MADRTLLRLSATLLFLGFLVFWVAGSLHPPGGNDHQVAFANIAASGDWAAIHLGQFVGTAVLLAGLLVLLFALNVSEGTQRWVGLVGAIAAGVALAVYGVLQAVDGVANKQADDAWVSAPAAEKAARFASAEAIRWLEWGTASYYWFLFALALALVLFAIVIVRTARFPRPIGYLMGLQGITTLVQGWVIGTEGISPKVQVPSMLGSLFWTAWTIWLLIAAWRMKVEGGRSG